MRWFHNSRCDRRHLATANTVNFLCKNQALFTYQEVRVSCRLDLAVRVRHRGEQLAKLISHTEPAFANGDVASGHRDPCYSDLGGHKYH